MNSLPTKTTDTIEQVLTHYLTLDKFDVSALGNGLINQTYLVSFSINDVKTRWVLQQINTRVFPFPEHITENADNINQHLIFQKSQQNYPFSIPNQILTREGKSLVKLKNEYWRVMEYVSNSFSIEEIVNHTQAQQVAHGFASFATALADFPADTLHTIIPDFLNINTRIKQLTSAIKNASPSRLKVTQELRDIPIQHRDFIDEVNAITQQLPLRTVHHDTKINNLLFSQETQQVAAVIDLDTCMPGYLMYDFGDMVRSCCSTLSEDDADLTKLALNTELLEVLAQNYITPLRAVMTPKEHESLAIGVILLPLILGIRFLTDYLNGDLYFKIAYQKHNLDRAANQLALFQQFLTQRSTIQTILTKAINNALQNASQ